MTRDEGQARDAGRGTRDADSRLDDSGPSGGDSRPPSGSDAEPLSRRDALVVLGSASMAVALPWPQLRTMAVASRVPRPVSRAGFFTAHEFATVRVLADLVIPRDARSGSASDAGVPEFMDFIVMEYPTWQTPIRGGLAWLDAESRRRYARTFLGLTDAERRAILDDIAYPARARPELSHGVEFFTRFRDLTASGFWSSRMGVEDLRYQGNTMVQEWTGCPEAALQKLGVAYDP